MAVASPYAVFRATDLNWIGAAPSFAGPPPAAPAITKPAPRNSSPRKRPTYNAKRQRPAAARLVTLIQGELFQSPLLF